MEDMLLVTLMCLLVNFITCFHEYCTQTYLNKRRREIYICALPENNNPVAISVQFQLLFFLLLKLNQEKTDVSA